MKKVFALTLLLCSVFGLSGCLVVAAGAAVGIVGTTGDDSAYVVVEDDISDTYALTLAVLKKQGKVTSEDKDGKMIVADIEGSEVKANITDVGSGKSKVVITARKWTSNFTDQELAKHLCDLIDR